MSVKCFAHTRKILMSNTLWDDQRRIDFLTGLKRRIPEFPPNARVLLLDDPWTSDWGPMFLAQLMYDDPTLWLDRVKNAVETGDRNSYDLLMTYQQPLQRSAPSEILGLKRTRRSMDARTPRRVFDNGCERELRSAKPRPFPIR